jgi:hypothetical protein
VCPADVHESTPRQAADVLLEPARGPASERAEARRGTGDSGEVNAIPKAAQTIVQDLDDPDPDVHQKAATLLLKYTLGNSSIAPPPVGAQDSAPMQVFIGMPQQGAPAAVDSEATEVPEIEAVPQAPEQAEEPERECLECHLFKPPSEFVGASHRCNDCQKKLMDSVTERYPDLVRSVHASSESSPARIPSNP